MPFASSIWTIPETIVWICTRKESLVDSLDLRSIESSTHFFLLSREGGPVLASKERRATQAQLIDALADSKLRATGISTAKKLRVPIPSEAWLNMKLIVSCPRPDSEMSQLGMKVWTADGSIGGRFQFRDRVFDHWEDIRLYRSEILTVWAPARQANVGTCVVTAKSSFVAAAPDPNHQALEPPPASESTSTTGGRLPFKTLVMDACKAAHAGTVTNEMLERAGPPPLGFKTGDFRGNGNLTADAARWLVKAVGWGNKDWRGSTIEKSLKQWRDSNGFASYSKNASAKSSSDTEPDRDKI